MSTNFIDFFRYRTSANACEWLCRPLVALGASSRDSGIDSADYFSCSIRRSLSGLLLHHVLSKGAAKESGTSVVPSRSEMVNSSRGNIKGRDDTTTDAAHKPSLSHPQRISHVLLDCLEAVAGRGHICIPWTQV